MRLMLNCRCIERMLFGWCLVISIPSRAQDPTETFEVASVKINNQEGGQRGILVDPGRFTATAMPLIDLIRYAYGFNSLATQSQVSGGPSWIGTTRFDIVATANGQPSLGMLKSLLQDRFSVVAHIESQERSIYTLVRDKEARLGPKIHVSTSTCEGPGIPQAQTSAPGKTRCGVVGRPGAYAGEGASMSQMARALGNFPAIGRVVLDATGLGGVYDWTLEWTPSLNNGPVNGTIVTNPDADAGLSIFTALREQLGLRLQSGRAPVDILVIDQAELPTPN